MAKETNHDLNLAIAEAKISKSNSFEFEGKIYVAVKTNTGKIKTYEIKK